MDNRIIIMYIFIATMINDLLYENQTGICIQLNTRMT